jgi:hypothetical protein
LPTIVFLRSELSIPPIGIDFEFFLYVVAFVPVLRM